MRGWKSYERIESEETERIGALKLEYQEVEVKKKTLQCQIPK